jgi:uncharacterized membrane protein (UPF0127 family)
MMEQTSLQLYKIVKNEKAELMVSQLEKATNFFERGKGLLGRAALSEAEGLWISPCNNIHTFFMKFNIDCVFVDENLVIKKISSNLKPFRVAGPVWSARSVIELKAGTVEKWNLSIGDQLYVVS